MRFQIFLLTILCLALVLFAPASAWAQSLLPSPIVRLYFPHVANGDQGNGVWQTKFVFVNNSSSTATATLQLFTDTGGAFVVGTDHGSSDQFSISIPPRGSYQIETDGGGSLRTGWGRAFFNHAVVGSAVFSLRTSQGKMTSVGVLSTLPKITFLTPADANTGIAVTNIYLSGSQTIELRAYDQNGTQVGETQTITVGPRNHTANTVQGFFPTLSSSFVGSVKVRSLNSYLAALAIGAVPNSLLISVYSVPAIAYDELPTSYTGSYSMPSAGDSGTITWAYLEHFDSSMFLGTFSVYSNALGRTLTGPLLGNVDDFGLEYTFYFFLSDHLYDGVAVAQRNFTNDNLVNGIIADDGQGYSGTFTATPQPGSGTTVKQQPLLNPRPSKASLGLWDEP